MAISFDNKAVSPETTSVSSITLSLTIGSISNGGLFVTSGIRNSTGAAFVTITGITWNGTENLTLAKRQDGPAASRFLTSEIWYLKNPTSGTHNIVVTYSGTIDRGVVGGISLAGVDQSTVIDVVNGFTGTGAAAPWTTTLTTTVDNDWLINSISTDSDIALTVNNGETQAHQVNTNGTPGDRVAAAYKGPLTPTGTFTTGWTNGISGADEVALAAISIKPAAGGSPSASLSPSASASASISPSASTSPSRSQSPSASASRSQSPSASTSPSRSQSPSSSASRSASRSISPSASTSPSRSQSPSASASRSLSPSASASRSQSPSASVSPSSSQSRSVSPSSSFSPSASVSPSSAATFIKDVIGVGIIPFKR